MKAMKDFFKMMQTDEDRAWYRLKEVERAIEKGAVSMLLVSNSLFRSNDVNKRKRYVQMVEDVKSLRWNRNHGLSSIHESGIQLDSLGRVAAILTFPLQDLDEDKEGHDTENKVETNG